MELIFHMKLLVVKDHNFEFFFVCLLLLFFWGEDALLLADAVHKYYVSNQFVEVVFFYNAVMTVKWYVDHM